MTEEVMKITLPRWVIVDWNKAYERFQQTTDVFDYENFLRVCQKLYEYTRFVSCGVCEAGMNRRGRKVI